MYRDNGKDKGNHYSGFMVSGLWGLRWCRDLACVFSS